LTGKLRNEEYCMKKPRLVIADDHELMLDGLRTLLVPEFDLVATVTDGRSAVSSFAKDRPDLLILDISLPLLNGIEVARQVKSTFPDARILFVTMQTDKNYVEQAFRSGALGYLLKQAAAGELIRAIRTVLKGQYYVSPQIAQSPVA
jgi:DNA-binding NarL/FixJ family response regulator